jgi:hypothetical protein
MMLDPEQLKIHADRIRNSHILGRSQLIQKLFDFFVECSLAGKVPKEIEVALDVFGKRADFDVGQDAVVRVYIHKLRRKLDDYYTGPGKGENGRLVIPRGEYRFVLIDQREIAPAEADVLPISVDAGADLDLDAEVVEDQLLLTPPQKRKPWLPWLIGGLLVSVLFNLVMLAVHDRPTPAAREIRTLRGNPVWARLLDDNLPIYIVVGDYYIFGELSDNSMDVQRMVREFNINSATDLEQFLKNNPELASRYMDLSLQYLPTSVAFALANVMPMLQPNAKPPGQVQVILASELTPAMVKSAHIVYIGLFSGMGVLRDMAFARSRFSIGESFDELVDRKTGKQYISQAGAVENARGRYRDYGYFSALTGPEGNEVIILAGTRDVALMHMAEVLTHAASVEAVEAKAGSNADIEALYAVEALDRSNVGGELVFAGSTLHSSSSSSSNSVVTVSSSSSTQPSSPNP